MDPIEFIELVADMRRRQRERDESSTPRTIDNARGAEATVDYWLKQYFDQESVRGRK